MADVDTVLRGALQKIEHGWCQNSYASTRQGEPCTISDHRARCFCSLGAINAAGRALGVGAGLIVSAQVRLRNTLADMIGELDDVEVAAWNDRPGRTQAEVIDLFKRAIKED